MEDLISLRSYSEGWEFSEIIGIVEVHYWIGWDYLRLDRSSFGRTWIVFVRFDLGSSAVRFQGPKPRKRSELSKLPQNTHILGVGYLLPFISNLLPYSIKSSSSFNAFSSRLIRLYPAPVSCTRQPDVDICFNARPQKLIRTSQSFEIFRDIQLHPNRPRSTRLPIEHESISVIRVEERFQELLRVILLDSGSFRSSRVWTIWLELWFEDGSLGFRA